jgi:hypothetical protein
MKKILFIFCILPLQVQAELTSLQKQILTEPVTMLDVFVEKSERRLSSSFGSELTLESVQTDEGKKVTMFPIETLDDKDIKLPFSIQVLLDFDRGKWIINSWVKSFRPVNSMKPTIRNAQNLCKKMLNDMELATLSIFDAEHRGHASKSYLQGVNLQQELDSNTIHSVDFEWDDYSKNPRKRTKRSIECEKVFNDPIEKTTFNIHGDWE